MVDIVIYSDVLNQHQIMVSDALYHKTAGRFRFVELKRSEEYKGGDTDFSSRKYLIRSWESPQQYELAMHHARTAGCCIFSGIAALPFERERLRLDMLSFDMSERWLKRGLINIVSPHLLRWLCHYYCLSWRRKPLYKLCCSAYCSADNDRLGIFKNRSFRWGYFPAMNCTTKHETGHGPVNLMWCGRYISWKHPELPILLAYRLRDCGYDFHLHMYGGGELEQTVKSMAADNLLSDYITFYGPVNNEVVHAAMGRADIFLFTSDANEGWGAVANESMYERCALVAGRGIGSVPYLINDRVDGMIFRSPARYSSISNPDMKALEDMYRCVKYLLDNMDVCRVIQNNAHNKIAELWSAEHASDALLTLISELKTGVDISITQGPCSKA